MRRWIGAFVAVVLACIPILLARSASPSLLADTDTSVLLGAIRDRHAPLSWFITDWPLKNHFYRPVSTLAFEIDNLLYRNHAAGYGLTNALLCVACVLMLFWFLRELTDSPAISGSAAALFALQHTGLQNYAMAPIYYLAIVTAVIGVIRHGVSIRHWAPACLVLLFSMSELAGMDSLSAGSIGSGTIGWLPGRTATVMTMFALAAMALYARYERSSGQMFIKPPCALDMPATKSKAFSNDAPRAAIALPFLSLGCVALAFGAYEQAVMLPAIMLAIAVTMHFRGYRVRWGWQAGFWLILVGYLLLRKAVIPPGASGYQLQQFRKGPGVAISLFNYGLPFVNSIKGFLSDIESGFIIFVTPAPYSFFLSVSANLTTFYQARRRWILALAGYGMSIIAFLPMAWVKQFAHYNYWPMALRTLLTVTILWIGLDLIVIAWSPRSRQAPPRLDPAPGSLPHR
ncbi:MAG: hypothetical protein P4L46_21220 [Fimbriimonas sp.]|nr:hypothetical protein [Fimbriimonas sp.]